MGDTYPTTFRCENCGDEKYYNPQKGYNIKDFLDKKQCLKCSCYLIQYKKDL